MNYRWHSGALDDLEEATVFYFQQDPKIELRFPDCIDKAIEVTQTPYTWPIVENEIRRYLVNIFPYSLFYTR
jgi:hypothetical protein